MNHTNPDYEQAVREFYSRMGEYLDGRKDTREIVEQHAYLFEVLSMNESARHSLFTDWLIFDYTCRRRNRIMLQDFLHQPGLTDELKELYRGFLNNVFSAFEVKTLRIGRQLVLRNLFDQQEYEVHDAQTAAQAVKGQCLIVRLLPFKGIFVLTGWAYCFPPEVTALLKLSCNQHDEFAFSSAAPLKINLLDIIRVIAKRKTLPIDGYLLQLCIKAGAKKDEITRIIREAHAGFQRQELPGRMFAEIAKQIPLQPDFIGKVKPIQEACFELWNTWVDESQGASAVKGPLETGLIRICLAYLSQKVKTDDFSSPAKAEAEANRLQKKWLAEPKSEFGGKTPVEVILEERKRLGNPQTDVSFSVNMTPLEPGADFAERAEMLYASGFDCLQNGKPKEAVETFLRYLEIAPWNHVAWHNLAVAYLLLRNVQDAVCCMEKALELKPDYKLAKKNLRVLRNASDADIEQMAREYRVMTFNTGKRETITI